MAGSLSANQTPEQVARDEIDKRLLAAGWQVQDKASLNPHASLGVAVREFQTDIGPADYVLFVDGKALGVVEAKPDNWGERLTIVEEQSAGYAAAKLKWVNNSEPLPFVYESTSVVTRFTDGRDPAPRSREVFTFHRPETLKAWANAPLSLRAGLQDLPELNEDGLRTCQINAITKLEKSLQIGKPRALVQMATGSGKTFTSITQIYRLLKHAGARRILFLVDTKNLGEQAEGEFMAYLPNDDNRKFTELYNVQRLTSPSMAGNTLVSLSTTKLLHLDPLTPLGSVINSDLKSYYQKAKAILETNQQSVRKVAEVLLEQREIGGQTLAEVLKKAAMDAESCAHTAPSSS